MPERRRCVVLFPASSFVVKDLLELPALLESTRRSTLEIDMPLGNSFQRYLYNAPRAALGCGRTVVTWHGG